MNRKRPGRIVAGVTAALFLLALAAPVLAQTGMLKGKVVDGQDQPVEGAKVTIAAKGMKSSREVKTNKRGEWVQIGLFPGEYSVTAEKDGNQGVVDTRVSIGENPEVMIRVGPAGPSPEAKAKAEALQKAFDEGVALSKAGDYDGSVAKFNEAIGMAPNCQDCYYNIGFAHSQKKEWEQAEAAYKKALEIKPDYAAAWNALAAVYSQQKKLDLALEATNNAAKYSGGDAAGGGSAVALYNQGAALWNMGAQDPEKYKEAKAKFDAATKADPKHAESWYMLGLASLNTGDNPTAITAFEEYLKLNPSGEKAEQVKGILSSIKK